MSDPYENDSPAVREVRLQLRQAHKDSAVSAAGWARTIWMMQERLAEALRADLPEGDPRREA